MSKTYYGFEQVCIMSHGIAARVVLTLFTLLILHFCSILMQLDWDGRENKGRTGELDEC